MISARRFLIFIVVALSIFAFSLPVHAAVNCNQISPSDPGWFWCSATISCASGTAHCSQACSTRNPVPRCVTDPDGTNQFGDSCYLDCNGGGGGSCSGSTEFTPVWLRVVEKSPSGGTIAWKPQGMGINTSGNIWSGNGLDSNGNFQTYRAFSDFVNVANGADITNPYKNFDLSRNKQGNLWIASPNILSNGINWSNHFCGIGRAAAPDAEGQLRTVSAQNTSACGPLAVDVEQRSGTCNAFAKPDVDGCVDWAKGWDQNSTNLFGVDSDATGYPGQYMSYLNNLLNFVDNTSNPLNWVDIKYDEYWSFSYLARSSKDCEARSTDLTFTPPTGYKCSNVGFYVQNNDGTVSYRNAASTIRYNNDGSCYLNGPLKSKGNLVLIEIQSVAPPITPAPAPHGEINIPVNEYTKACFGSELVFDYKAYSSSSPISRNEIAVRNAAWPESGVGYIPWVSWLAGTSAPALNRRDSAYGILDANLKYGAGQQMFSPGNTYWFAQVVYDSQPVQRMCSGSPIVTYPNGGWEYCGNAVYSTSPKSDFYGNRPWKKIRIPANVTTPVSNLTATRGNGFISLSWRYLNNLPEDLIGFRVWRLDRANPAIRNAVNNGEIVPITSSPGSFSTYFATDYGAICDGNNSTYQVEVISGYISPYPEDNYGPVVCSSVRSNVAGFCYPSSQPRCSISPSTATVFSGQNPTFTFTASSFNAMSNTYEQDITSLTETLNGATRSWATGTPPSAADMNAAGTYSENFTLSNLTNDTTVSMTVSDALNSYTCTANIDVQKAIINVDSKKSTSSNSDYLSYCNTAGLPSNSVAFSLTGPTNLNSNTPLLNFPINPNTTTPYNFHTSTASTTEEVKCIIVSKNGGTPSLSPRPIGNNVSLGIIADGDIVSVTVVTGPVLNTEAWFQTQRGASQYGAITNLGLPLNTSTVNSLYLVSGNAYYFRGTTANDYGSIFTFKNNFTSYAPNTSITLKNNSVASNPKNMDDLFQYIKSLYNANSSNTPANAANIAAIFSRSNASTIAVLDHPEVNKNGGTYLDINYSNLVSETTKGVPVLIRLKQGSSDGNMYINKNIIATGTNFKHAIFFAEGTITIDPSVTQLDGIFIAVGGVLVDCTKTLGLCDSKDVPLNIRGSVLSKVDISFMRNTLNTPAYVNNVPGVFINYSPSMYFMSKSRNFSTINTYVQPND